MSSLGFTGDFKLNLTLVAYGDVFDAARLTENRTFCFYALGNEVSDTSACGFFFDNAGDEDFSFSLERGFFCCQGSGHNHGGERSFGIYGASGGEFAFVHPQREMSRHCIHVSTQKYCGFAFAYYANDVSDSVYANLEPEFLHFLRKEARYVLFFAAWAVYSQQVS